MTKELVVVLVGKYCYSYMTATCEHVMSQWY